MLVNRSNGLANALVAALLVANGSWFVLLWRLWEYSPWNETAMHGRLGAYVGIVFVGLFYVSRRLFEHRSRITTLSTIERATLSIRMVCGFLLGAGLIYFLGGAVQPGRFFILFFVACSFPFNVVMLRVLPRWLVRRFFPEHQRGRAVLVGSGTLPTSLRSYVDSCRSLGVEVVGHYGASPLPEVPWPYLGELRDLLQGNKVVAGGNGKAGERPPHPDCVLAFNFDHTGASFQNLVEFCSQKGVRLQAYARLANVLVEPVQLVADGNLNFLVFMNEPLEDPLNRLIKRTLDIVVAGLVVTFLLPWLAATVWLVQRWQSPGPIIFRQLRYGANRRSFLIYKFRTMHVAMGDPGRAFVQARVGDPRVYPFGRFMRKMSLDEFPQFLNVLRGEMSVVGPRPHPVKLDEDMEGNLLTYRSRHFVRPGITGYAQVLGLRGETADSSLMIERVRKDIQYVSGWSLTFDLKIMMQTAWQIFFPPKGAY